MGESPFIKFYPSDFLAGTSGLSPAERGVYITLLCLIYEADGPIERHDARLSRRCGSPKAAFQRTLEALIDEGKIVEADGMLSNKRAEKAIVDRQNRSQTAAHAAQQRWSAQSEKTSQNQSKDNARAMPGQCPSDASQNQSQNQIDTDVSITPLPPKGGRAEANEISETLCAWASPDAVASFIAYRKRTKGKALTLTAAKRLASNLQEIFNAGGDTDDALGLAEERGWQSVKPEWYFNDKQRSDRGANRPGSGMAAAFAAVAARSTPRQG